MVCGLGTGASMAKPSRSGAIWGAGGIGGGDPGWGRSREVQEKCESVRLTEASLL